MSPEFLLFRVLLQRCNLVPKCWTTIGFTVCSLQNVEKPLVLLCFRSKRLKKHWFYCVFAQNCWKTIGFTSKTSPSHRQQPATSNDPRIRGLNQQHSSWIHYEEPLQTSCLGNKKHPTSIETKISLENLEIIYPPLWSTADCRSNGGTRSPDFPVHPTRWID